MDTSGLLILAMDKASHRNISIQFQHREVEKQYTALLRGVVKNEKGTIDLPIRLDVENRPYQIVDFEKGKKAITHYKRIGIEKNKDTNEIYTRVLFSPETGRTHQLRVHSKEKLFPIVGDRLYGVRKPNEKFMALHASYIKFKHPTTNEVMEFYSHPAF
jgi:tRNA pseudouridine32 synthase/23S rRNA pseudouridine746 synthase